MSNKVVALNQTNVSVRIKMLLIADGANATGIVAATGGHEIWYQRAENTAEVTDATAAADLSLITSVHSDWGFKEVGNGWYRVDLPDAAFAEGVETVLIGMETTLATSIAITVDINPMWKFQGNPSSVTGTSTTFPGTTNPDEGDVIVAIEGTGIKQQVLVTSVSGQVATHLAWPRTPIVAATTTTRLIGGNEVTAQGGSNADVASSTLATSTALGTAQTDLDTITGTGGALINTASQATLDAAATAAALSTAQTDLNTITGTDGVTLATAQALYAPSKAGDAMDLVANAVDAAAISTGAITTAKFAAGAIDAAALATDAVTEIAQGTWSELLGTTTMSASALMQITAGVAAGKVSGAATSSLTIRNIEDDEDMIIATVDSNGNRTATAVTAPSD